MYNFFRTRYTQSAAYAIWRKAAKAITLEPATDATWQKSETRQIK